MSRMQINGAPAASDESFHLPLTARVQTPDIACGALGEHLHALALFADEDKGVKSRGRVSLQQADNALRKLMGAQSEGAKRPTVRDVLEMDPMMLSMMMSQLVLKVSGNNANALCQQLKSATDLQEILRNKQVEKYQEQINKAIEQADLARKAGIFSAVFDWVISSVEVVVGVLKVVEGAFTADPLAIADGAAYFSAGIAGMVKAGAETALVLGADKSVCNDIIKVAGAIQTTCECVALALDIVQIGLGIRAARAITKATEEVLELGVEKALIDAVTKGAENELKTLAEKAGQEISRMVGKDFGMALEREMVEVGDMAAEAAAYALKAESNMVREIGKSFTREGVAKLVETAIKDAGKDLLKQGEKVVAKELRDTILKKLSRSIIKTVLLDCVNKTLLLTRAMVGGANYISSSIVAAESATLQRDVEHLMVQQGYIDFMQDWMEGRKKTQQKRLNETYQDGANALRIASEIIDDSGTVLAHIAGQRA